MMNRRDFLATSAVAATQLGKPHAPLVPEDDPAIVVERVTLRRPDGNVDAYAAYPKRASALTPGIVICMHIWGVDAQLRDTVRRFAEAGFNCIAPDLYARNSPPSGDGTSDIALFKPFATKLVRAQYDGDLRAAALHLTSRSPHGRVGVAGFCMGGHIALVQALDNADVFAACAPFYGAVKDIDPLEVHVPICGSYGEKDQSIPADDVRAFRNALRVANDIRIYPNAGHAFFDDTRGAYVASAAQDAWKRTIAFFSEQLGLP